jgi:hypothetical protein
VRIYTATSAIVEGIVPQGLHSECTSAERDILGPLGFAQIADLTFKGVVRGLRDASGLWIGDCLGVLMTSGAARRRQQLRIPSIDPIAPTGPPEISDRREINQGNRP